MDDLGKDLVKDFLKKEEKVVEKVRPEDVLGPNGEIPEYSVECPDGTVWGVGEDVPTPRVQAQVESATIILGGK